MPKEQEIPIWAQVVEPVDALAAAKAAPTLEADEDARAE